MAKRSLGLVVILAAISFVSAGGQSSADGSVHGNVYTNRYFKVSLMLPPILHAVDLASLNLHRPSNEINEFLMMAAREGDAPYGIVMMAEKLNATSHIQDGQDFLRRVPSGWNAGQVLESKKVNVQPHGLTFEELDYGIPNVEFDSAIVTQVGDYLLAFKCNAKSSADRKMMVDAVTSMHRK
jgi:hypothetical protein